MGQVLAQLIPIALAAALSTVPITATLFILLSERRKATALPFLSGWVLGTAAGLILATVAAQSLPGRPRQFASLVDNLEILVGGAFVLFGLVTVVRHARTSTGRPPKWIEGIGSLGPLPVFGIGLALNLRPKALLLVAAASLAISGAPPGVDDTLFLILIYTAIATSTVRGTDAGHRVLPRPDGAATGRGAGLGQRPRDGGHRGRHDPGRRCRPRRGDRPLTSAAPDDGKGPLAAPFDSCPFPPRAPFR